jgi:hypothetical protein
MRDNSTIELVRDTDIVAAADHLAEIGFEGSTRTVIASYEFSFLRFGLYADQICSVTIEQGNGNGVWYASAVFTMAAINTWADVYVGLAPHSEAGIYTLSWPLARIRLTNTGAADTTVFNFRALVRKWR